MRGSKGGVFVAVSCLALAGTFLLPGTAEAAKKKAAAKSDFQSDAIANMEHVAKQLISLAEAMPADKFSWRPAPEVRTVSAVYMHVVGANLLLPSMLGSKPPAGVTIPEHPFELAAKLEAEVTTKEEVITRLRDSFAYATQAIKTFPVSDLDTEANIFGFPASKRGYLLILLSHAHEHLGQSIAYARSIGVVPPWSVPKEAASGGR